MERPRILAIMGSGETAPTMAKVHRALFDRLAADEGGTDAGRPIPAVILDTPYGFQENAAELSRRTVEFFATSVGQPVTVASYRSREADALTLATALARISEARYVMAGPGSPSYALRQWAGGPIPEALVAKLARGGVLAMASAAALTVGAFTIPVYEVYKAGEEPRWLEGLDLLGKATGLRAAVVPHYDNAEGGTHDTRFCYMGERRLRVLEAALPAGTFILGVDSHTALVLDFAAGTASVSGLGGVTVRVAGRSAVFPKDSVVAIDALDAAARELAAGREFHASQEPRRSHGAVSRPAPAALPLRDAMADLEGAFIEALGRHDARTAVASLLDLEAAISARVRSGEDSPDLDNASATFRALIARLGERAEAATADPRETVRPFVEALLEVRARARSAADWPTADLVRDRLAAAGVEVRDGPDGSTWLLAGAADG
jgi:cyanophycinase-like exopeptidase